MAPWTRSRIIAESSISLSGLPRYFSASIDDLGAVLAHVDLLGRPADGVERVGDADHVLADGGDHEVDRAVAELGREAPDHADVDHPDDRRLVRAA